MKLVLASEGFHTSAIIEAFVRLCGKPKDEITFAVINEAYAVESGDKRWMLENLNAVASNFKGEIDFVNLLALTTDQTAERIQNKDAIFVVGGNTDYLMSVFNKSGFSKLLPKLLESKVYVGSSAGSMVIGNRISTEAQSEVYGEGGTYGIERYMELVNFALAPHLDSPSFPNNRIEVLERVVTKQDGIVYGLKDDNAVIVDGETVTFVKGKPFQALAKP